MIKAIIISHQKQSKIIQFFPEKTETFDSFICLIRDQFELPPCKLFLFYKKTLIKSLSSLNRIFTQNKNEKFIEIELKLMNQLEMNIQDFIEFNDVQSPYQVIYKSEGYLQASGFERLKPNEIWALEKAHSYYVKNDFDQTLVAFSIPENIEFEKLSFKVISSSLDFGCLRLLPKSKLSKDKYLYLGVGEYGVQDWKTWMDREVGIGGRVIIKDDEKKYRIRNFNYNKGFGFISSDQSQDEGHPILCPLLATQEGDNDKGNNHYEFLLDMISNQLEVTKEDIIDFDLCLTDSNKCRIIGPAQEYITGARISDIFGAWAALQTIINNSQDLKNNPCIPLILLNSNFENHFPRSRLYSFMNRIVELLIPEDSKKPRNELKKAILERTFEIRNFNAKAFNSFNPQCLTTSNSCSLNKGIVISRTLLTNYPSNSVTRLMIKELCEQLGIEPQQYVRDGETQANIEKPETKDCWITGLDLGIPIMSMHKFQQTAGIYDLSNYQDFLELFLKQELPQVNDDFF